MAVDTMVKDNMVISSATRPTLQIVDRVDSVKVEPVVKLERSLFNLEQALNGVSIGFYLNGELVPVLGFKENDLNDPAKQYVGTVDGVSYYFNSLGGCNDLNPDHTLQMLNVEIPVKRDIVASRGDSEGTETIEISSLQPREQFALAAMQSIISKLDTPILLLDGYKITQITTLAFNIANSMMNFAAEYRAETKHTTEPSTTVEVDETTLTSNGDKILYNLAAHLESLKKSVDIINNTLTDQINKTKKIDIASVSAGTIKTEVENTPDVRVVNIPSVNVGTPNVIVENVVPVSGTVSVDNVVDVNVKNFPSSE